MQTRVLIPFFCYLSLWRPILRKIKLNIVLDFVPRNGAYKQKLLGEFH